MENTYCVKREAEDDEDSPCSSKKVKEENPETLTTVKQRPRYFQVFQLSIANLGEDFKATAEVEIRRIMGMYSGANIPRVQELSSEIILKYNFSVLIFLVTTEAEDDILVDLGIHEPIPQTTQILFYYRPCEIYACIYGKYHPDFKQYFIKSFSERLSSRLGNKSQIPFGDIFKTAIQNEGMEETFLRSNSSMFGLSSMKSILNCGIPGQKIVKFRNGCVFVSRTVKLTQIPEILNHFAKICANQITLTHPEAELELDCDYSHLIDVISPDQEDIYNRVIGRKLLDSLTSDSFSDKFMDGLEVIVTEAWNVEQTEIFHKEKKIIDEEFKERQTIFEWKSIGKLSGCPSTSQVICCILQMPKKPLTARFKRPINVDKFMNRVRDEMSICFTYQNGKQVTKNMLEVFNGRVTTPDGKHFWKIGEKWFNLADDFYFTVHAKFTTLLMAKLVENIYLPKRFTYSKTVKCYINEYINDANFAKQYLLPPATIGQNVENCYFDLLLTKRDEEGNLLIHFIYIFDNFNCNFSGAASRITKSVKHLVCPGSIALNLLTSFWNHNSNKEEYTSLFPHPDYFYQCVTKDNGKSVGIVIAVATGKKPIMGQLDAFFQNTNTDKSILRREKELKTEVDNDILKSITGDECIKVALDSILTDSELCFGDKHVSAGTKLLKLLETKGLVKSAEPDRYFGTGKLRKTVSPKTIDVFKNNEQNNRLYEILQKAFISNCPGFIQKLECFDLENNLSSYNWSLIEL